MDSYLVSSMVARWLPPTTNDDVKYGSRLSGQLETRHIEKRAREIPQHASVSGLILASVLQSYYEYQCHMISKGGCKPGSRRAITNELALGDTAEDGCILRVNEAVDLHVVGE